MGNVWVIAKREYLINVRRAGFIIFTLGVPVIGLLLLVGGAFFSGAVGTFFETQFEGDQNGRVIIGVVDEAAMIGMIEPDYTENYQLFATEDAGKQALRTDTISALIVIPPDYLSTGDVRFITLEEGGGFSGISALSTGEIRQFLVAHLLGDQLDPALRNRLVDPVSPIRETLALRDPAAESEAAAGEGAAVGGIMFGYFFGILLGIAVFTSAGYLLQGVARDKSDRIVEILLSSVSARQLLAGKVLGLGALGLTQLVIWIGSLTVLGIVGTTALGIAPAVFRFLFARPEFLLLDVLYFILGFLLYALLMGSVGALGTSQQESQQLAGIFTFLAVIPFMLGSIFISNPDASVARFLSWFPLTAPTAMLLRLPLSANLPWIDIVISLVGLLLTITVVIWIGGKIFRLGLLIYGQRPSIGRVWQALREA